MARGKETQMFAFIRDLRAVVRWYREASAARPALDEHLDRLDALVAGQIVGHGVAGRSFTPGEDVKRAL